MFRILVHPPHNPPPHTTFSSVSLGTRQNLEIACLLSYQTMFLEFQLKNEISPQYVTLWS